jgi:hypothetical protein
VTRRPCTSSSRVEQPDEITDRRDLVGLFRDVELSDHGAVQGRVRIEPGQRRRPVGAPDRTAQHLAVDRHEVEAGRVGRSDLGGEMVVEADQSLLERRRPDHGQDFVQLRQG